MDTTHVQNKARKIKKRPNNKKTYTPLQTPKTSNISKNRSSLGLHFLNSQINKVEMKRLSIPSHRNIFDSSLSDSPYQPTRDLYP